MRIKTSDELQGPNLMVSRHGATENLLQTCAQCRHLIRVEGYPDYCDQFVLPSGYHMPSDCNNRACGLFMERDITNATVA